MKPITRENWLALTFLLLAYSSIDFILAAL